MRMYVSFDTDMRICMTISADYRIVIISTGMNGPAWEGRGALVLNICFPSSLAFSPSYVDAYASALRICVRSDRVTEAFPYFAVGLIWPLIATVVVNRSVLAVSGYLRYSNISFYLIDELIDAYQTHNYLLEHWILLILTRYILFTILL